MVDGSLRLLRGSSVLVVMLLAGAFGCTPTQVGPGGTSCSATSPCPDGESCVDGTCSAACTADSCVDGFCDEASGACIECRDAADCGPGQVCNANNACSIAVAACFTDGDCGRGFCDNGSCIDCRTDGDCGDNQACDPLTRACVAQTGCNDDGDCAAPTTVCNIDRRVCVECLADDDCGDGRCDTISSTCLAGCTDGDETEPNEGAEAVAILSGGEHSGRICSGDVDEFVFSGEGSIAANITVDGAALTLTLLNAAGTTLATNATNIGIADAPAGTYRLRVSGAVDVEADYLLRLTVTPPPSCTELDTEPNNSVGAAIALPTTNTSRSGSICGTDIDLWSFVVAAGDDVTVALAAGEGSGVPRFVLENSGGTELASGTATTPALIDGATAGTIFVRVSATGGDVGYSLRASTSAAPPVCSQTDAEPNDLPAQALPVASGTTLNGQICAADVDQWRFSANANDDLAVVLTGSNVRARVFDAGGGVVAEGTSSFTSADLAAGNYRIEVKGTSTSTEAAYSVTVTLTPEPAADPCQEGGLEPDSATAPRLLNVDGTIAAGRICAGDTDFYRFTLPQSRLVSISTRFTHVTTTGDLEMRLKDGSGTVVETAAGTGNEELIVRTLPAGTYSVEVFGFQQSANTYTVSVTAAADCTDDGFEPNDAVGRAPPISGRAVSGVRCPTNDDFFALRLETGDSLDMRLTGTGLTMSLLSSTGSVLQNDSADGANRRLQLSQITAGRYVVRITGSGVASSSYTLTPTIVPSPVRCIDDGAEANDTTTAPFIVDTSFFADGSYDLSGLTMCPGDDDVFAFDVGARRSVRFDLAHVSGEDLDIEVLEQRGSSGLYRTLSKGIGLDTVQDIVAGNTDVASRILVRVVEFDVDNALPYALGIELGTPAGSCIDDRFDSWTGTGTQGALVSFNNDARVDASFTDNQTTLPTPLSPPETLPSLQVCAGDVDVYAVTLAVGQRLSVGVTYTHATAADIDLRVFGPDDSVSPADADAQVDLLPCSSCNLSTGTESFAFTATRAGQHFIEVFEFQNDGANSYQLSVTVQ